MPVTATTAQELFIGAGEVYVDGQPVGATMENNMFRVTREYYAPDLNGTPGPLKGTDYVQSETAELEVSIPELDPTKLAYMVPGSTATAQDGIGVASGASTTLASPSLVGDSSIVVTSATGIANGDVLQIGAAGAREFRTVLSIAGAPTITLEGALAKAHAATDPVIEVTSSTIALDAPAGSTNLKVASVMALVVGDYIRFGYPGEQEVRKVTFVGTTGVGGTGVSFNEPTALAHRAGDFILEQTNAGSSIVASTSGTSRRLPSTAYHDWELRVSGLDGREIRFGLSDAIMTENAEFEAADDGTLAPRLTLQARWDPASITTSPWYIEKIGATA
jgi:hypothetical protein